MSPHYQDESIVIHKIKCGPYDNNAYVLVAPQTNESILIDTPADPGKLIDVARTTDVQAILITHNHFDHIEGFEEVRSVIKARVGIGEADAGALPSRPDFFLKDGDDVTAGALRLKAISTPGHTDGSTCLLTGPHLFTGDTLFPGGPGKSRSPEAFVQLVDSVASRLLVLDQVGTFYPGHGDDGELAAARKEQAAFASKSHPPALYGDVLWLKG